ncbi:BSD domain-containing protein 1-like [Uloborus diversus]|uniref:BSD domain-containing protein 1-like n=1 Tax=Uloborus diversus TaxID=327109 RepID=UPI0024094D3F|nr:BSD domain-containing protein 1-like [Uloborus diversus]
MDEGKDEENNNEVQSSSWWGTLPSWFQVAKEKSSNALEFMKRDLTEFSHVVQTDAVAAVSSTAAIIKEKLTVESAESVAGKARQSISSVLETITDVFAPQKEIEDTELIMIKNSEPVPLDWWQSQLYMIRKDPKTFSHEPEGPPEMYENWLESFDASEHQDEMAEVIMTCSEVRALYDKLVPTSVSHLEFWQRYFYRVHLLRKAQAKRADLMRRAEQISIQNVEWDQDDSFDREESNHLSKKENENSTSQKILGVSNTAVHKVEPTIETPASNLVKIPDNQPSVIKTVVITDQGSIPVTPSKEAKVMSSEKPLDPNESADVLSDPSSVDSTDESRSSPVDSLGKDSTGDDWEKDFDLEVNEIMKNQESSQPTDSQKEDEDDWEKWQ